MSKTVDSNLQAHLAQEVMSVAMLVRVARQDGTVKAFTDHDVDIVFDGVRYYAIPALEVSAVEGAAGLTVSNLDAQLLIDSDQLTTEDLRTGLYDKAAFEMRLVNYKDLSMGAVKVRFGILGEVSIEGERAGVELRGLAQFLQQTTIVKNHTRRCTADLGDSKCQVDTGAISQTGTVVTVTDRRTFTASGLSGADDLFNHGLLTWTAGSNTNFPMEVKRWVSGTSTIDLFLPEPHNIAVGDTFTVYPGCDKNLSTCRDVFNNVINFQGFPFMPGRDQVAAYPDSPY